MAHEMTTVDGDLGDLLHKSFIGNYCPSYIKVDGVILPEGYKKFAEAIENFEVRNDDIWMCTFPKCGTTWVQEMVWCIANDLDFERAKIPLIERCLYFEVCTIVDYVAIQRDYPELEIPENGPESISKIEKLPSPRFIKTHLPFHLLPKQIRTREKTPKIISIFRNAKDTCISYYHHCRLLEGYRGNFHDFCKLFLGDTVNCGPFWTNILGVWEKRTQDNVLILKFEEMKRDLPSIIRKTAKFLGKNLTNDQVSLLNEHLSFTKMKNNPAVNNDFIIAFSAKFRKNQPKGSFIRSGTTEQWKSEMTPDIIEQFDNWSYENLKGTDLSL